MVRERGIEPLSTDDIKLRILSFAIIDRWHFNRLGKAKNFIFNKPRHNSPCLHPSFLGYK